MSATYSTGALDALAREIDAHAAQVALHILKLRAAHEKFTVPTDHGPTCCPPVSKDGR